MTAAACASFFVRSARVAVFVAKLESVPNYVVNIAWLSVSALFCIVFREFRVIFRSKIVLFSFSVDIPLIFSSRSRRIVRFVFRCVMATDGYQKGVRSQTVTDAIGHVNRCVNRSFSWFTIEHGLRYLVQFVCLNQLLPYIESCAKIVIQLCRNRSHFVVIALILPPQRNAAFQFVWCATVRLSLCSCLLSFCQTFFESKYWAWWLPSGWNLSD